MPKVTRPLASTPFPGLEEVLQDLRKQWVKDPNPHPFSDPAAVNQLHPKPVPADAKSVMGQVKLRPNAAKAMNLNKFRSLTPAELASVSPKPEPMMRAMSAAESAGSKTLAALRGAGGAVGNVASKAAPVAGRLMGGAGGIGGMMLTQAPFAGHAAGEIVGDALANMILSPEDFQRPARQATKAAPAAPVAAQPAGVQSVESAAFIPPEFTEEQEGQQIAADSFSPTVRFEMPATPPAEEQPVEILGDPDTIVQEDPNDLFAQQLRAIAEMPPHTMEREQVNPADERTIAAASKNHVERPTPPKETFGRKVKRFVTSFAGGSYDPTRLDALENDLYLQRNRMTDPEQFGANVAAGNVRDTKQFNRAAQVAEYGTGGIHPATKFALDLLSGERKNFLEGQRESTGRRETHANQVDLIGRSAAAAKLSPEHMKAQALWNMAEKNPDGFASFIYQQTGYQLPPEFVKSIMESRSKNNAENERFQMFLSMLPNIAGGAARKPLNTSSIAK